MKLKIRPRIAVWFTTVLAGIGSSTAQLTVAARSEPTVPVVSHQRISLPLEPAASEQIARGGANNRDRALEGTHWSLIKVGRRTPLSEDSRQVPYLQLQADGRRILGTGGCNRLTGTYELRSGSLYFGAVGSTMMACDAEIMKQERQLIDALRLTTAYRISGDRLELVAGHRVLAEFSAAPEK